MKLPEKAVDPVALAVRKQMEDGAAGCAGDGFPRGQSGAEPGAG
jgi:hypothetical protein